MIILTYQAELMSMGRAEDLFQRFLEHGMEAVDEFIETRQSEELFLDFKRSADQGTGSRLHDDDRKNLARAISGFGNSEGGIVVWGVDCRENDERGDVASKKKPLQNLKRFVSWLEGAVSGCTVPPHSLVRHHPIEIAPGNGGFVVTYIPKSHLAPHQTIKPQQYYIRAGSDFLPAPHAVLSGLFGRHPQPFVFHTWSFALPSVHTDRRTVQFTLGFTLANRGPGIARDLYVTSSAMPPLGGSNVSFKQLDETNWEGRFSLGIFFNLMCRESFRLPPHAVVTPFSIVFSLCPPFQSELSYEISFGHHNWPTRKIVSRVSPSELERNFLNLITSPSSDIIRREFALNVFNLHEPQRELTPEEYDRWIATRTINDR